LSEPPRRHHHDEEAACLQELLEAYHRVLAELDDARQADLDDARQDDLATAIRQTCRSGRGTGRSRARPARDYR
jgi:hypothetical protein